MALLLNKRNISVEILNFGKLFQSQTKQKPEAIYEKMF